MTSQEESKLLQLRQEFQQKKFVLLSVKAIPRSSQSECAGFLEDGSLRIKVKAAPEGGKANQEICRVISNLFHVPERQVEILSGRTALRKRIRLVTT
jgi:uncharacterized protein